MVYEVYRIYFCFVLKHTQTQKLASQSRHLRLGKEKYQHKVNASKSQFNIY